MPLRTPAFALALIFCLPAFGWNSVGHEVISQIALDQLTAAERGKLAAIARAHPRYDKDLLAGKADGDDADRLALLQSSAWPDTVRTPHPMARIESHPQWHYVDFPYCLDGKTQPPPVEQWDGKSDPVNLLQAFQKVTAEFKDPATAADRRAIDLCWIMHLAGDIHQPLHAVSLYNNTYPTGDKGGNSILFATALNPKMNLHAVWDNLEGTAGRNYRADPAVVRKAADRLEKDYPADQFADALKVTDVRDWAQESFKLAKASVYLDGKINGASKEANPAEGSIPPLPAGYEDAAKKVADSQCAVAGYRLANLLRELLKDR